MIKVLHCADMHLDTPFSLEDIQISELRRRELRSAFVNMMMYARDNMIDIILLPGDLFDSTNPGKETVDMVVREFTASRKIKIVVAPGNHDPACPGSVWEKVTFPDNVYIFRKSGLSCFVFDDIGTAVWGYAFTSQSMSVCPFSAPFEKNDKYINIICGHGDTSHASSEYCPVTLSDIRASGVDYIALGHIHARTEIQKAGATWWSYCGCLEGRDFGECGHKGATVALMEKKDGVFAIRSIFVRFSRRRYEVAHMDVTGVSGTDAFAEKAEALIRSGDYGDDTLLRLVVEGEADPSLKISRSSLHGAGKRLFYLEVRDQTVPAVDFAQLSHDPTIRGAFYDALLPVFRDGNDEERQCAERALRYGLAALSDNDIVDY